VIEGALYAGLGLFLSGGFATVILLFPKPVLGIILLFEALALLRLTKDVAGSTADFSVTLLVGVIALALPYGYAVGLVAGTLSRPERGGDDGFRPRRRRGVGDEAVGGRVAPGSAALALLRAAARGGQHGRQDRRHHGPRGKRHRLGAGCGGGP
jgi:hypothetical protein